LGHVGALLETYLNNITRAALIGTGTFSGHRFVNSTGLTHKGIILVAVDGVGRTSWRIAEEDYTGVHVDLAPP
jgi:hypothetical protein